MPKMTATAPQPSAAEDQAKTAADETVGAGHVAAPAPAEGADSNSTPPATEKDGENEVEEESEEAEEDDEQEFAEKPADTLLGEGKTVFRSRNWAKAAEYFSRAVERKVAELGGADFHPELSTFYLWFGDALLTKEEQNAELFQFDKAKQDAESGAAAASSAAPASSSSATSSSSSTDKGTERHEEEVPGGNAAGKVSDEELAFEMLEMAKQCLLKKLEKSPPPATSSDLAEGEKNQSNKDTVHSDVIDLSFAFVRLADMQLMNERYDEAAQDYGEAVSLRERYRLPEQTLMAPLLSLAQATFFSGKKKAALDVFKRTLAIGKKIKDGFLGMPDGMTADALADTIEDLQLQITDVEKQIAEDAAAGITNEDTATKGSQCAARECIATTTSTFDAPQLDPSSAKVVRVSIRPASAAVSVIGGVSTKTERHDDEEEAFRHSPKKRRIDLRQLQGVAPEPKTVKGEAELQAPAEIPKVEEAKPEAEEVKTKEE
ncbi:tetratricopeptide repeat-containing protein [Toxoplasma gondii ME49]|uniref:Tetratricopeptide repeat-containing protein n=1 Tax=Toxoplasma gondii (strain ATCC 50611 / Me49) TaxID=508771 RepID=S8F1L3_TOXGM|nr:tetratricopeptide repeat-containing protein [Toxoplasma gondii ME49]EPT29621.1 tetratricopeptide repeat-containing protein [Toxoplasma gondii ME49]|eukprot:XP_002365332.1 tetratricopeptide repeat-containing protein [Toxoplasma gondii ME49]